MPERGERWALGASTRDLFSLLRAVRHPRVHSFFSYAKRYCAAFNNGYGLDTTDAEARIDQFALNWRAFAATGTPSGVGFAILHGRSGELVGCCGVDDWSKEDVAQFGYWLAPNARGRGYATRAAILLTRWLFDLGAARVFLTIVAGNEASVAVARRAGFVYEGTMRPHGVWQGQRCEVMWFAALPLEWTMRRSDEET
jgi:RimJ/RimL family protein N-acetyltransferase